MGTRGAILALMLLLAACRGNDAREPFTDNRIPPSLGPADWPPTGWTWGLVQTGREPPQRYGVAAPDDLIRGQVLILPGYGQSAEDEYRLARALVAHRFVVWVLDGAGQGGSGRVSGTRDLGQVESFAPDLTAIEAMIERVTPSDASGPLILVAQAEAAPLALRRLQLGARVTGVVLLDPMAVDPTGGAAPAHEQIIAWARRVGLGRLRAQGGGAWSSGGPEIGAGLSPAAHRAWRTANPDLRMGGPSYDWLAAYHRLRAETDAGGLAGVTIPSLVLGADEDGRERDRLCRALPRCVQQRFDGQDAADQAIVSFAETLAVQGMVTPKWHALSKPSPRG